MTPDLAAEQTKAAWAAAHAAEAEGMASWAAAASNAAVVILIGVLTLRNEAKARRARQGAACASIEHACEVGLTVFSSVRLDSADGAFDPRPFRHYIENARSTLAIIAPQDYDDEVLVGIALNARTTFTNLAIEATAAIEVGEICTNAAWLGLHGGTERNLRRLMEATLLFKRHRLKGSGEPDAAQKALLDASRAAVPN